MSPGGKLLTIAGIIETIAVVFAYLFSFAFGSLVLPQSAWWEVVQQHGLYFLLVPAVTVVRKWGRIS